jgi:two-component system, sensor histidine kinase LadS
MSWRCWGEVQSFSFVLLHMFWASEPGQQANVTIPLQQVWEAARIGDVKLTNKEHFDPAQVWQWPAQRFDAARSQQAYTLRSGERYIARVTLFSEQAGTDLNLSFGMPRLDAVHVSYRYDAGAWKTLSAGDTLPMNDWALPQRQPSFDIPLASGQLDIVVQVAHRGNVFAPALLQNDRAYLSDLTGSTWVLGLIIGVNLVLALFGVLLALNFRRASFLAVSMMSFAMALVLFFGSGLGGLYLGTSMAGFNDHAKFFSHNIWCLALPWVAAVVMGMRQYALRWWSVSLAIFISGLVLTLFWMDYAYRDTASWGVPLLLISTLLFTALMVGWAWLRRISRQPETIAGIVAYILALLVPYVGFTGVISQGHANSWAAAFSMLSAILLMRGLYLLYRMGRQVMARANISPQRDVLTGLLNRTGFERHLQRLRERIEKEQTCAAFIYLSVADVETATQMFGEEGFEMGMVQIAATLSSSVSGVDGLGRVSHHAFGVTVMMPPDPALATRLAQKILSRMMALATHGTPLAGSTRMAIAWLPLFGFKVESLERRSLRTLIAMDENKRIGWVGGQESHAEAAQMLKDARLAYSTPSGNPEQDDEDALLPKNLEQVSNLSERIRRIEREMLQGVDTRFLMAEAERMSRAINEAHSSQTQSSQRGSALAMYDDHPPTEIMTSGLDSVLPSQRAATEAPAPPLRPLDQWSASTGAAPLELPLAAQRKDLDNANWAESSPPSRPPI